MQQPRIKSTLLVDFAVQVVPFTGVTYSDVWLFHLGLNISALVLKPCNYGKV